MNDNNDFFLKQMKGVNPIKKKNRIEREKINIKKQTIKNNIKLTNNIPVVKKIAEAAKNSKFSLENIHIKKSLKNKSFKIDKKIDFHGMGVLESEELFSNTIVNCYNNGLRCLLFVTGKGLFKPKRGDNDEPPKLYHGVIRGAFTNWIKSNKFAKLILSYEKASFEHGGDGAFYVYLRKKKN